MLELRLSELARNLGVACESGDAVVTGLAIDSRAVKPGDLFVAIDGEHVDGHDFIDNALDNGAAAIACTRPIPRLGDRNHGQCWQNNREIIS